MKIFHALAVAAALSFSTVTVFAQTPAAPAAPAATGPAATTPATAPKKAASTKKQRTAKSLECSKKADADNVHGKKRKAFMNSCKKA